MHLVDNMVKLGALYNRGPTTIDRLEQSQLLRERALLEQAQEQRRFVKLTFQKLIDEGFLRKFWNNQFVYYILRSLLEIVCGLTFIFVKALQDCVL